jgi:hypothetical protein
MRGRPLRLRRPPLGRRPRLLHDSGHPAPHRLRLRGVHHRARRLHPRHPPDGATPPLKGARHRRNSLRQRLHAGTATRRHPLRPGRLLHSLLDERDVPVGGGGGRPLPAQGSGLRAGRGRGAGQLVGRCSLSSRPRGILRAVGLRHLRPVVLSLT